MRAEIPDLSARRRMELPTPLSLDEARARARKVLKSCMDSSSERRALMAAEALARCCSVNEAWEVLSRQSKAELWTRRHGAAAALARLGKREGIEVLKESLGSRRRSVRWAAAFALARLGDDSGARLIRPLLNRRRYRLTCAEALINVGDERARAVLEQILRSKREPRFNKLRAAVALGRAGREKGRDVLKRALDSKGVSVGAALVLAEHGDPAARRVLVEALDHSALRAEAAAGLARLGERSGLTKLVNEMESPGNAQRSRLSAAVAVMELTRRKRAEAR
jgi:HEAT repeat protein